MLGNFSSFILRTITVNNGLSTNSKVALGRGAVAIIISSRLADG
jgi:hypothetical protein|tara:strand:- start:5328 stop:5459 length:132 start_codon:yes stop_codon:yes gene_type:complete